METEVAVSVIARSAQQRLRGQILDRVEQLASRLALNPVQNGDLGPPPPAA